MTETLASEIRVRHDRHAPYWAAALVTFAILGISTTVADYGAFWSGYVLDMTGPAWNYILFRLRFTEYADNAWTRFFTPTRTLVIFLGLLFGIEGAQFFNLYASTFDPLDLLAYVSILIPLYVIDLKTR